MGVMDEVAPGGGGQNPAAMISGIQQLLATIARAKQGAGQQQAQQVTGGGIVPQLPAAGTGGGASGGGAAIVPPPGNMQPPSQIQARNTQPTSVTGANSKERDQNVAQQSLDQIGQAVWNYKAKKQADAVGKAQSSYRQYQQAIQAGDMQTANYIATDPKVVSSWEKYLNEYINKVPGPGANPAQQSPMGVGMVPQPQPPTGPGAGLGNVNTPGGLAVPRDMRPPDPQKQAELEKTKSETQRNVSEAGKYDVEADTDVIKAKNEQLAREAEASAARAREAAAKAKLDAQPLENDKLKAESNELYARAKKERAEAEKAAKEAGEKKTLTAFQAASGHLKDARTEAASELKDMRTKAEQNRGTFSKMLGSDPDVTPEMQAVGNRVRALSQANIKFNQYQDDIVNGKMTVTDGQNKARRAAGLDSNLEIWGGMPEKTQSGTAIPPTPPKEFPEGGLVTDSDGTPLAVKENGQWVAP